MKITDIDVNFAAQEFDTPDVVFYDAKTSPFAVYGVRYDGKCYRRMPETAARNVNEYIDALSRNTSGGRVRFRTDSPYLVIWCAVERVCDLPHMTRAGIAGFSVYVDGVYCATTHVPPIEQVLKDKGYRALIRFSDARTRDITIYMPLYNGVDELYLGLARSAVVEEGGRYTRSQPILLYGSSITQGGCVSRPGNSYDAIVARRFDSDYINLGFSGSCKAEPSMTDYLVTLDCSVFIYDYDHNCWNADHLQQTHYPLYRRFRDTHPETPIIFMSKPDYHADSPDEARRRRIVRATWRRACREGDQNVYYIDGAKLFGRDGDCCTTDSCHPNDLGFYRMAEHVTAVLKKIWKA